MDKKYLFEVCGFKATILRSTHSQKVSDSNVRRFCGFTAPLTSATRTPKTKWLINGVEVSEVQDTCDLLCFDAETASTFGCSTV